jgi:hypothetical protein
VLQIGQAQALSRAPQAGVDVLGSGNLVIRYGVRYLGKPHLSIIPGLVALDYGDVLTGEAAWNFLLKRSNIHPRADVFGFRNDGVDDMIVVKLLDLAQPVDVFVFANETANMPYAQPTALIALADAAIPPRLLEYLPRYDTFTDWQNHD